MLLLVMGNFSPARGAMQEKAMENKVSLNYDGWRYQIINRQTGTRKQAEDQRSQAKCRQRAPSRDGLGGCPAGTHGSLIGLPESGIPEGFSSMHPTNYQLLMARE